MSQLAIGGTGVPTPPEVKLTERQRRALEIIAAHQPIASEDLGRALSNRPWSNYDKAQGAEVGAALRDKHLARYSRKRGGWVLADWKDDGSPDGNRADSGYDPATAEIPF